MDVSLWMRFTATKSYKRGSRSLSADQAPLGDPCTALRVIDRAPKPRALRMQSYPKFHNEIGVPIVRVGCREFKCIGAKPPQDHPHIYLSMSETSEIVCRIALRYFVSIRAWAHMKLIQQIVLTMTWTEVEKQQCGFSPHAGWTLRVEDRDHESGNHGTSARRPNSRR